MMSDPSFREDPFRLTPDQRLPYQSFAFQETFQLLIGALREGRGPVLLTGEAGTGKTLLLRVLKRELEQGGTTVCFPSLMRTSRTELLSACLQDTRQTVPEPADEADEADEEVLLEAVKAHLGERSQAHRRIALLVDDAQDLSEDLLEILATLWSLQEGGCKLLSVVLVGHPNLRDRLVPYFSEASALAVEANLRPLEAWEIRPYILHRLRAAGYQGDDLMVAETYGLIQERSRGVPRRINLLCGTALMLASLEGRGAVTVEDVEQALRDNWLDGDDIPGVRTPPAKQDDKGRPRSSTGAARVRTDFWVERIQRVPDAAISGREDRPMATAITSSSSLQNPGHRWQQDTPAEIDETVAARPVWPETQTRIAADPNEVEGPLPVAPMRADERDALHEVRRSAPSRRQGHWLRNPLLAAIGLAGGIFIGGVVAAHYGGLSDVIKAQLDDLRSTLGLADASADKPEQMPAKPVARERIDPVEPQQAVAAAYSNLAIVHQTRGEFDQAEVLYKKALEVHEALGHRDSMARDYNNLGYVYWSRGDLEQAERVYRKSLALHEALADQAGMADNYVNLGSVYWTRRDLDQAEAMYRQALTLNQALDRKEKLANNYGNLGVVYQTRGDLDRAQAMHQKAIEIYERGGRQTEGLANAYGNLGSVYRRGGDLAAAEKMYMRALGVYQRVGNHAQVQRAKALISALRETNAAEGRL